MVHILVFGSIVCVHLPADSVHSDLTALHIIYYTDNQALGRIALRQVCCFSYQLDTPCSDTRQHLMTK